MIRKLFLIPAIAAVLCGGTLARAQNELIRQGADGRLQYRADARGNRVPDFSLAGYGGGGVPLPDVPVKARISPIDGDDTAAIQAAIDSLGAMPPDANGFRGALLMAPGIYDVTKTLRIGASGIVIRGSGAGRAGTVIVHRGTEKNNTFYVQAGTIKSRKVADITSPFVPVGANRLRVGATSGLAAGQAVTVLCLHTQKWVDTLKMTGGWKPESFALRWIRRIVSVDPATGEIVLDGPITSQIDTAGGFATGEVHVVESDERIARVGFEDLAFVSEYDRAKKDPYGYFNDEDHANVAVQFSNSRDCWLRRSVGFFYTNSFVRIRGEATRTTVEDCAMIDGVSLDTPRVHSGSKKYYFDMGSGSEALVQRCYGRYGRHTFVMNGPGSGNVALDSYSEKGHLAQEPHQRWQHGSLFDGVYSDSMFKLNRSDDLGSAHGQRAANCMLWNCVSESYRDWEPEIHLDQPVAGLGSIWAVGCVVRGKGKGVATPSPESKISEPATVESLNAPVSPRSLYLAQLTDRLGAKAVENVTTAIQRTQPSELFATLKARYTVATEWGDPRDLAWMPERFGER